MLKTVKTSQLQGISGNLKSWIPVSRHDNIFSKVCKNNTNMLGKLVFKKLYEKPTKNTFFCKVAYYLGKSGSFNPNQARGGG